MLAGKEEEEEHRTNSRLDEGEDGKEEEEEEHRTNLRLDKDEDGRRRTTRRRSGR